MHQQQWLAVIEELGGVQAQMPIPNSTPQEHEATEHSYAYLDTLLDREAPDGRWSSGPSFDGRGEFTKRKAEPMGQKPDLGKARPETGAQKGQM
jgi:Mn-containing catalase